MRGKPTRLAPIPKPAPWRAVTPTLGETASRMAKTTAARTARVGDLIQWQSLLRDQNGSSSNNKTLNQVLNNTIHNFSKSVAHLFYIQYQEKNSCNHLFFFITFMTSLKHSCPTEVENEQRNQFNRSGRLSGRGCGNPSPALCPS
jgi:hypothetical protein